MCLDMRYDKKKGEEIMREIKFRAWHTEKKRMFSAEEMGRDQLTLSPDGRGFVNVNGRDTKLSKYYTYMIPMQYIGLVDEKGKSRDWWEDDILQPIDGSDRIGIIAYSELFAEYEIQDEYDKRICSLGAAGCDGWKKVGNIHQNPELLGN